MNEIPPSAEKFLSVIEDFTLYDPVYFHFVFNDEHKVRLTQVMLRIITGIENLTVRSVQAEYDIANLLGRGIRMDIRADSEDGSIFDAEFQREKAGADPQRARFNSSLIDANLPKKGADTNRLNLPATYVIMITESDVLGGGLPIYHIERVVRETGADFGDGSHIIYVNGAYDDTSTQLGKLIHDFRSRRASEMLIAEFADRTREIKETEREVMEMSSKLEELIAEDVMHARKEGRKEGREEGMKEGREEGMKEGVMNMAESLRAGGVPEEMIRNALRSMPFIDMAAVEAQTAAR